MSGCWIGYICENTWNCIFLCKKVNLWILNCPKSVTFLSISMTNADLVRTIAHMLTKGNIKASSRGSVSAAIFDV